MDIQELFRRLSYGPLSNLSVGSEGAGTIVEAKHPNMISLVNQSLLRLYSRYVLKEDDVGVICREHITKYDLSVNSSYIMSLTASPFQADVIKVMSVFNSGGTELALNDVENQLSLFTPSPTVLQVPMPVENELIVVKYQARHVPLAYSGVGYLAQKIVLPSVLEEALIAHVAMQVYGNMNGQENMVKSADHRGRFEEICREVTDRDTVNSSSSTTTSKLHDRGFA